MGKFIARGTVLRWTCETKTPAEAAKLFHATNGVWPHEVFDPNDDQSRRICVGACHECGEPIFNDEDWLLVNTVLAENETWHSECYEDEVIRVREECQ